MTNLDDSNNAIILKWAPDFLNKVNAEKVAMGIKHKRIFNPSKAKAVFRKQKGSIDRIGVLMSKGEIMTHKGVGRGGNRTPKPWFNPTAEVEVNNLADQIMINTGDVICGNLIID
jgi:hypothetical protein